MTANWIRGHTASRRCFRGATWKKLSPRGQYLSDHGKARWEKNFPEEAAYFAQIVMTAELGSVENFRFMSSSEIK